MLSGDDMICYLLFPEVSFHCIDKWRKPGHAGVQMTLRVQTQVLSFLNHFPVLSLSFSLLFVVVKFIFGTVTVAEVVVVGLNPRIPETMCLPPSLSAEAPGEVQPRWPFCQGFFRVLEESPQAHCWVWLLPGFAP